MKEHNTYEVRCTYCGKLRDLDQGCECGRDIRYEYDSWDYEDDYYYYGFNKIDNILEDKRSGRYRR